MQQSLLKINGVQTQVITEGRWVEEGLAPDGSKHVVVVIPGNPGIPEFYEGFIQTLKSKLPTEIPIWVIGHAGHIIPPNDLMLAMPSNSTWNEHYSLSAQIKHKIEFIKTYVPKDAKLHIVGHSIGSWIVLNLLKEDFIAQKTVKCYMLFPTIEHMAKSPNGFFFVNVISRIVPFILFLCWIFSCFPMFLQIFLIRIVSLFYGIPARCHQAVIHYLNPHVMKRVIKLANEEMNIVKEPDYEQISKHKNKLWFYYGTCDGWTPVRYYKNLKSKQPDIDAELCKLGLHHSFVLLHDKEMGQILGDLINENISKA